MNVQPTDDTRIQLPPMASGVTIGRPLSERLRLATEKAHHEVEHGSSFNRLIMTDLRGESGERGAQLREVYRLVYEAYLVASLHFEKSVLCAIDHAVERGVIAPSRYLRESADVPTLIVQDLDSLGSKWLREDPGPFLTVSNLSDLLGMEYVRRGSRNGNAVIAGRVGANLGFNRERGAAFLNIYGRDTRARFVEVQRWIDAFELSESERSAAEGVAISTFQRIGVLHKQVDDQLAARLSDRQVVVSPQTSRISGDRSGPSRA